MTDTNNNNEQVPNVNTQDDGSHNVQYKDEGALKAAGVSGTRKDISPASDAQNDSVPVKSVDELKREQEKNDAPFADSVAKPL